MNNIDITNYPHNRYCSIYDKDNELITFTNNDLLFEYIRYQIVRDHITGCYIIFDDGKRYDIDEYGYVKQWPKGLFDNLRNLADDIDIEITKNLYKEIRNSEE